MKLLQIIWGVFLCMGMQIIASQLTWKDRVLELPDTQFTVPSDSEVCSWLSDPKTNTTPLPIKLLTRQRVQAGIEEANSYAHTIIDKWPLSQAQGEELYQITVEVARMQLWLKDHEKRENK